MCKFCCLVVISNITNSTYVLHHYLSTKCTFHVQVKKFPFLVLVGIQSMWCNNNKFQQEFIEIVFLSPRMTILPSPEKLKDLLKKVKEFHLKFLEDYSQPEPQMNRSSKEQHRETSKQPEWWFLDRIHSKCVILKWQLVYCWSGLGFTLFMKD